MSIDILHTGVVKDIESSDTSIKNKLYLDYYTKTYDTVIDFYKTDNHANKSFKHYIENDNIKSKLAKEYKFILHDNQGDAHLIKLCSHCNIEKHYDHTNDLFQCLSCNEVEYVASSINKIYNKDGMPMKSTCSYKRSNHFNEWLLRFQGKEIVLIPNVVYDNIHSELHKRKISNYANLTTEKMRDILKYLKYNKYYENVNYITSKITGKPPLTFTSEEEERLRSMFKDIQEPFKKHCPSNKRRNLISYSFVLRKFCELIGLHAHSKMCPLLKNKQKLRFHDMIWQSICKDLGWAYKSSI